MKLGRLWHGTLTALVPAIMHEGLKPRGEKPSHDEYMDSASMSQFVYLTSSEGVAIEHAARISERTAKGAPITLLMVDMRGLDTDLIYPDEDYLSEEWNSDFSDWEPAEQLEFMKYHQDKWPESLKMFRTIAYRAAIPPTAISVHRVPAWAETMKRNLFRDKKNRVPYLREETV